jgi:hypothetical protein
MKGPCPVKRSIGTLIPNVGRGLGDFSLWGSYGTSLISLIVELGFCVRARLVILAFGYERRVVGQY